MTKVEAFARAWASMDGRLSDFIACKQDPEREKVEGRYEGYMADAEELIRRAKGIRGSAEKESSDDNG
jgi:hypothetical protein